MAQDIQQQLDQLHSAVEELRRGKVGPRGPAGDVSSATRNAVEAIRKELADTLARIDVVASDLRKLVADATAEFHSVIAEDRTERRQSNDNAKFEMQERMKSSEERFRRSIENEVLAIVISVLKEYYVLDQECRVLDSHQRPRS